MAAGLDNKFLITDGKKFKKVVDIEAEQVQLPTGLLTGDRLRSMQVGSYFYVNDKKYFLFDCTLPDFLDKKLERKTQIMYPKEISYLIYKLDITPGDVVGEAGTGSGAMALSLSQTVGPEGQVYTYEEREDFEKVYHKNFRRGKRFDNVIFHNQSLQEGLGVTGLDAFILDVREPWKVLSHINSALKPSGNLGVLVPTMNQVSETIPILRENGFYLSEITEIMIRKFKHNPDRFRPEDVMVGHTGYLILSKKLVRETD